MTKNRAITCGICDFEACKKCWETYILGETVEKCMNPVCGKPWTRKRMMEQFTPGFINGPLKNHKKNLLFERERGMLPATQAIVEEEIRLERIEEKLANNNEEMKNKTNDLRKEYSKNLRDARDIRQLLGNTNLIIMMHPGEDFGEKKRELSGRLTELIAKTNELDKKIREMEETHIKIRNELNRELGKKDTVRKVFVRACPEAECRGFLSSQWKCGLCDKWTCPDCHVVKEGEHICNPDDVATATLLSNDTKPCPKCKTGIFKINGCDQMFCTQCHTGFSWNTGQIETRMHNPHYFEWMRRRNEEGNPLGVERNPLEVICGREIDGQFTSALIGNLRRRNLSEKYTKKIVNIASSINHLTHVILPQFAVNDVLDNQDLRVKFLRNKLSENEFKTNLLKRVKSQDKKREHRDVLVMFQNTMIDMIYRYNHAMEFNEDYTSYLKEVDALVVYVNECLWTIARTFGCVERELKYHYEYDVLICAIKMKPEKAAGILVMAKRATETTINRPERETVATETTIYRPEYIPDVWRPPVV